jgi:hypothetical protein
MTIDKRAAIEAASREFWTREENERLAPVRAMLASATDAWNRLVRNAYGSPEHPNYTRLIDSRKA